MTPAQCIEARRLLELTQLDLAKASRVSKMAIVEFEATGHLPRAMDGPSRMLMLTAFFKKAGLEFGNQNSDAPGVKLRKPES